MFVRGEGVFHSNTVHLIVLSKKDYPIYQEEKLNSV